MSKIICDICGTSYPETAKQCPVCGCVRPGDVQRVTNEINADENGASGYTYVKGGRFSKSNVKKRNKTSGGNSVARPAPAENAGDKEPRNSRGLVIAAIVLLLAIIGVVIYIAVGFFGPIAGTGNNPADATTDSQVDLSCKGITLDTDMVILSKAGDAHLLSYKLQPANTKDPVTFTSVNPEIATVNENGSITAVADGETKVIIKCGNAEEFCIVYCQFEEEPTAPTATTETDATGTTDTTAPTDATDATATTAPTVAGTDIRLNRNDITLQYQGEKWELYSGSVPKDKVTFTSENESVVTFQDGWVTAVGGSTEPVKVHAEYAGQKVTCLIRCMFQESSGTVGNGGVSEDGGVVGGGTSEDGGATGNVGTPVNLTGTIINVQESVNVRSDAGTEFAKTGVLPLGQQVTITETKNDSTGMQWGKTSAGWVRMDYVQLN